MELVPLSDEHDCETFCSSVDGVDNYLHNEALKSHKASETRTSAWTVDGRVVGYFTLRLAMLEFVEGGPRFSGPKAPGFLIAKFGIDKQYQRQRQRNGAQLLASAVIAAADASDLVGGRFIVVDAAMGAHEFYRKYDFTPFRDDPKRLYMKIETARSIREAARTP